MSELRRVRRRSGRHAIIYDCNIEHEQYWAAYDSGELHNSKSGKCLSTAGGGGTANGTEVIQWTCNGGLEQQWIRSGYQWVNVKAEKCLSTAGGGGTSNNTRTVIWDCNTADEMHWTTYN